MSELKPRFFKTPAAFRAWLEKNHDRQTELWVGYYRKSSGRASITWQESVDEALCFGWIDGVRKRVDEVSYTNRFTPRKKRSNWSEINLRRVQDLIAEGRMTPAGLQVYESRDAERPAKYSFEQRNAPAFDPDLEARFRRNRKAWEFFQAQPPGYRRLATFWVVSAKREETRLRRLATLIADSAARRRLGALA
jgi:uncharacterized protein YdeI (YjbR/CyaY-like superfamily)